MSYTAPSGNNVNFNFVETGYTSPDPLTLDFNFGYAFGSVTSTAISHTINNINIETYNGSDVVYVNTDEGIIRVFGTCSGTIDYRDFVTSDVKSGNCGSEMMYAGNEDVLFTFDVSNDSYTQCLVGGEIVEIIYYKY